MLGGTRRTISDFVKENKKDSGPLETEGSHTCVQQLGLEGDVFNAFRRAVRYPDRLRAFPIPLEIPRGAFPDDIRGSLD